MRTKIAIAIASIFTLGMVAGAGVAWAVTAHRVFITYQTRYGKLYVGFKCADKPVLSNGGFTASYGARHACTKI